VITTKKKQYRRLIVGVPQISNEMYKLLKDGEPPTPEQEQTAGQQIQAAAAELRRRHLEQMKDGIYSCEEDDLDGYVS
jgi:hypothetical protein